MQHHAEYADPDGVRVVRTADGGLRGSLRLGHLSELQAAVHEHRMMQDVSFFLILCGWLGVALWALIFLFFVGLLQ